MSIEIKENNGLHIVCQKRDMGWGITFNVSARFPSFITNNLIQNNKEEIYKISKYISNKLHYKILTDAKSLLSEINDMGFNSPNKNDGTFISYKLEGEPKSAFIRPFIYKNNIEINSFVQFTSVDAWGFTLIPGSFCDFIISENSSGQLFGYTKDFSEIHYPIATLFIKQYTQMIEDIILKKKDKPSDFEQFSPYDYHYNNPDYKRIKEFISIKIKSLTSHNKSKRIDTLIVNKKTIFDLMHTYQVHSSIGLNGPTLLNIAMNAPAT